MKVNKKDLFYFDLQNRLSYNSFYEKKQYKIYVVLFVYYDF